jgi:hypothetical protein
MRRTVLGLLAGGAVLLAGCTTAVPGTGVAAAPATTAPAPAPPAGAPPEGGPPAGGPRSALAADVVADECLLDALAFSALLGEPVLPPEQQRVEREDGEVRSACYVGAAGDGTPLAMVNVYAPREGTPADFVRAAPPEGRRDLDGVGEAAVLVDTPPGQVLQLAGPRHVVTVAVLDGAPADDAWRTAAGAALAALPA